MSRPRGRYAPSPTGELHLGNASSALLAWLSVRARGGTFVMRMEDLDRDRSRDELARQALEDLAWMGLDWDEGPDLGGRHAPYDQWSRRPAYRSAFEKLLEEDRLYACFCSRRDIAAAASAPQTPGDELRYPGTCAEIDPGEARERIESGRRHAWRFRVAPGRRPAFRDLVHGQWRAEHAPGDFVVYRADGVPAYQLAVVVDDAAMEIDEVVRGDDLLPSTARQMILFEALALRLPLFGHVPLLMGTDGARLSKRHQGITLRELRESGISGEQITGRLAACLGLRRDPDPLPPAELIESFRLEELRPAPHGIVVDTDNWPAT